jgi:integrase
MDLYDWLNDVYVPLRNVSPRTAELYRQTLDRFREFLGHTPTFDDLTDIAVGKFLRARLARGASQGTVAKDRSQIAALWNLAARRHKTADFPTLPPIRVPERVPQAWTIEEMSRIMAAVAALNYKVGDYPASLWWRGLILAIWDTGERIGALMGVRVRNLDLNRGVLVIPAELRKNKMRDLLFELAPDTTATIRQLTEGRPQRALVFEWPQWSTHIYYKLNYILKQAGLPRDQRSKFHRIRRTVATYFEQAGGDATRLLDHSNSSVTRKYIDPRIVRTDMPCDKIPRLTPDSKFKGADAEGNLE